MKVKLTTAITIRSMFVHFSTNVFDDVEISAELHPLAHVTQAPTKINLRFSLSPGLQELLLKELGEKACLTLLEKDGE